MEDDSGIKTYTRVNKLKTTAYYRWDNSVLPRTEAFPPGFRMIAVSDDNVRMERCNYDSSGREDCRGLETLGGIDFPEEDYAFVGIAMGKRECLHVGHLYCVKLLFQMLILNCYISSSCNIQPCQHVGTAILGSIMII